MLSSNCSCGDRDPSYFITRSTPRDTVVPSGHSTNTFAFFAAILFLLVWFQVDRWLVWIGLVLGDAATLLVGLSRITPGFHYPTDVLGGYAMSAAWCIVFLAVLPRNRLRPKS